MSEETTQFDSSIRNPRYESMLATLGPLVAGQDADEMAEAAVHLIADVLRVRFVSILLIEGASGQLVMRGATHIDPKLWDTIRLPTQGGVCGAVVTSGRPLLLNGAEAFDEIGVTSNPKYETDTCICAPIRIEGRIEGVINIAGPLRNRSLSRSDMNLIISAAHVLAAGLEKARLFHHTALMQIRLEETLDNLHVAVVAMDQDLVVLHSNHRFAEYVDRPRSGLRGQPLRDLLPVNLFNLCHRLIRETNSGETISRDTFDGYVDDRRFQASISATRFDGSVEADGRYTLMIEDLSHTEEIRRLQEADSIKRSFLRIVSHELRTPLTVLRGALPMLEVKDGMESAGVVDRMKKLHKLILPNVERLTGVVNDILEVVDIENGNLRLSFEPLSLNDMLGGRIEKLGDLARAKEIEWCVEFDRGLRPVRGDLQRLRQIFAELLRNAIKFSERESCIVVRTGEADSMGAVWVVNKGQPLDEKSREEVFEKFYQLDQTLTRKAGGCGLGLYLARNVINLHGGTISIVDGEPDEIVFQVRIPFFQTEAAAEAPAPAADPAAASDTDSAAADSA